MQLFRHRNVRGRPPHPDVLTPAEWRVLEHVRAGRSNPEIAVRLGVSVNTVRTHVSSMLAKLELRDRQALAAWEGEPGAATRAAAGRFSLAAPFAWLRDALGGAWVGKAAVVAGVAGISVAAVVVLVSLQAGGMGPAEAPVAPTAMPTGIPDTTVAPLAAQVPEPNTPFALSPRQGNVRLIPDGDPEGHGRPFAYDVDTEQVLRLTEAGSPGVYPVFVQPSPYSDVLLAWDSEGGTILFDLVQRDALQVLPVAARVHHWSDAERVLVTVDHQTAGNVGAGWTAGLYELDLAAMTITLLSPLSWQQTLSPDGSAVLIVSPADDVVRIVAHDLDGSNRVTLYEAPGRRRVEGTDIFVPPRLHASWSTDSEHVLVVHDARLLLVELQTGVQTSLFDVPEAQGAMRSVAASVWSDDGRYLAVAVNRLESEYETWVVDTTVPSQAQGPYRRAWPWAWQPTGSLLLTLADFCVVDGFHPALIDVGTGAFTVISERVSGIWYQEWSPDGSAIVAGLGTSVYLLDPVALTLAALPPFGTRIENGLWVPNFPHQLEWSASGRWLVGDVEAGRGRCEGGLLR